ncbi:calcium homeostasis modulator protein 2 [Austrofundulus limnaeus]|uniref:Calcium homeostasis modulator protein 2 n=1 Tax=Austrofundulus limnaeus TaxID=52670 RepID=A0A2I4BWI8_AUSLI|nr:PREDICTED: calcium homeostasis modulator protein 2 [Austrofundulus limnaeus]
MAERSFFVNRAPKSTKSTVSLPSPTMATAALISENLKFIWLLIKRTDGVILNGLIAVGTGIGQAAYTIISFNCPCSSRRNYLYSLAVIGAPALALFLAGVMMNRSTWNLLSDCRLRKCQKLLRVAALALLRSVVGRVMVAPMTWVITSFLWGQAYTCALSEFVDPRTLENFPSGQWGSEVMAKFPCANSVPTELESFSAEIGRRLNYESQLIALLLVAGMSLLAFILLCVKRCTSPLNCQQEDYWSQYRLHERTLLQRTASVHAHLLAAQNVKSFFGFVALEEEDKEELMEHQSAYPICSTDWNRITGVYLYTEKKGLPLYSRLNKWATYNQEGTEAVEKEMVVLN